MQNSAVQLNRQTHANLKLMAGVDLTEYTKNNMLPIIVHEMARLSTELPLVFVKNMLSGQFTCVALTGLEDAQNVLIKDDRWQGHYLPAVLTHYPFGLLKNPQDDSAFVVVVSDKSTLLSETEGEPLFTQSGLHSECLNQRIEALQQYYQCAKVTEEFTLLLAKLDVLEAQSLSYQVAGNNRKVGGVYLVNEKKLMDLSDEDFSQLKIKGFLSAIYYHLASINNVPRLIAKIGQGEA